MRDPGRTEAWGAERVGRRPAGSGLLSPGRGALGRGSGRVKMGGRAEPPRVSGVVMGPTWLDQDWEKGEDCTRSSRGPGRGRKPRGRSPGCPGECREKGQMTECWEIKSGHDRERPPDWQPEVTGQVPREVAKQVPSHAIWQTEGWISSGQPSQPSYFSVTAHAGPLCKISVCSHLSHPSKHIQHTKPFTELTAILGARKMSPPWSPVGRVFVPLLKHILLLSSKTLIYVRPRWPHFIVSSHLFVFVSLMTCGPWHTPRVHNVDRSEYSRVNKSTFREEILDTT